MGWIETEWSDVTIRCRNEDQKSGTLKLFCECIDSNMSGNMEEVNVGTKLNLTYILEESPLKRAF